ncbi:hypothetical protein TNCV_825101 [Trichonephila clavipes]|nr:hypothetical protein TNCV_825101 [Trichonephila clavipes]
MDNRNEPTDMDLIDSPRRTPTPPPLSASSFPPCVSPGCPHHDSGLKIITPKNSPDVTPTKRVLNLNSNRISNKRKEESDFEYPPLRKTTKKQILNIPNDSISITPNRFSLPSDSNIEEITGSQNAIPVVTPKPPSATGPTPSGNQNPVSTLPLQSCLESLKLELSSKPRCLKCGEGHITRECPITERLETAYCINWVKCTATWLTGEDAPVSQKPPKGTALNNRNSYTNVYNSIIRPNVSYAQAANPNKISTNFNSQNKQPMAPKGPVNSAQIEANRNPSANNRSIPNFNNNQPQKELKIYSNDTWNARLEALNTTDNSLWEAQRFLKNKRSQIPTLNCATGMAVTDPQKANLLANTIKNNFIENNRMQDNYDQDDEVVTSAVNTFLSSPPFYSN